MSGAACLAKNGRRNRRREFDLGHGKKSKRSCSRWAGSGSDKQKPFVKTKLLEHVRNNVTTLTVDSAGDELLSGEIMRTAFTPEQKVLCPNLRNVIRDKVRSSRRLTSRPWSADEKRSETICLFSGGKGSFARMMQHCTEIRRLFDKFAAERFQD